MANLDKMKQHIETFSNSETVQKEVGKIPNFEQWLKIFSLEDIPQSAIDELFQMLEVAEEKSKIALIDLLRLIMLYEAPAAHILNKHW